MHRPPSNGCTTPSVLKKHAVYANPGGGIAHAQLTFGNGMIMIAAVGPGSEWGKLIKQPDEIGGAETQSYYLIVKDADVIY